MRRILNISLIISGVLSSTVLNTHLMAQEDDNAVWSEAIPEEEPIEETNGENADDAAIEAGTEDQSTSEDDGSFTPTETIKVDSAVSFPVDI